MSGLRYRGDGRFLVGVPARDLTNDEIKRLPAHRRRQLLPSGLYKPVTPKRPKGQEDTAHE